MKILLTIKGGASRVWVADREELIFGIGGKFYNIYAEEIPAKDSFKRPANDEAEQKAMEDKEEAILDEISGGISSFSTIKEVYEYDSDRFFGNYGFKDHKGKVIIEPQYESVLDFSQGLCAVCTKRTWYRTPNGKRYYETLWGYIDTLGKVKIPYMFQEAQRFNMYGVAVVSDDAHNGGYLIDTSGKMVEGSLFPILSHYYDYDDRYIEFSYDSYEKDEPEFGLYDTKERRIALQPCAEDFIIWEENVIEASRMKSKITGEIEKTLFIDIHGNELFPWQVGKGFDLIHLPDDEGNSVVGCLPKREREYYAPNLRYGLLNDRGELIIPMEYDYINRLDEGLYMCGKSGLEYIVKTDD